MPKNRRSHWKIKNDMTNLPKGASPHLRVSYSNYNAVWLNPSNTRQYMRKSHIIEYSNEYKSDLNDLTDSQIKRLNICLNHLNSGKFIFDDDDNSTLSESNDTTSITKYNWDTKTHWLKDYSTDDYLVYSKEISNSKRLIYEVYRPVKLNGDWSCPIRICRCGVHKYENKSYGKSKNTLENIAKFKGDARKHFSDKD